MDFSRTHATSSLSILWMKISINKYSDLPPVISIYSTTSLATSSTILIVVV